MSWVMLIAVLVAGCAWALAADEVVPEPKWHPGHYVFVGGQKIQQDHILEHFRGVQKTYSWKAMEQEEGKYDFSAIRADLELLKQHGKQLVIQVQYKAFGKDNNNVPAYVRGEKYGGGVYKANSGSYDPVIWNAAVGERMDALFAALGREFDLNANVEAVVLPETSPSVNLVKTPQEGVQAYSVPEYVQALKDRMLAMRDAFGNTVVIQYANFPQEALPELTQYMMRIGVGMGGPDVYPRESGLSDPEEGVYRLYAPMAGVVPLGAAVQSPDYSLASWKRTAAFNKGLDRDSVQLEPGDDDPIPVREHLKLAQEKLKLNYMFWSAMPKDRFENVKKMLAERDLAGDPAGGLVKETPRSLRREQ